jgi:catechol 2,3-dioxygenase-like lactoylglutathione lyase family enzyme
MMAEIRGLAEIVIWVHDMEKALAFYRDTLGLSQMSTPDMRGAIFLQAGPEVVNCPQQLVLVPLPADSPSFPSEKSLRTMHHFGIEVAEEDFDSERQRLEGLGIDVRFGEHPFLQLRGMYLDDPDGNEVEIIARRPE